MRAKWPMMLAAAGVCLLLWQPAGAEVVKVKQNWDVGQFKLPDRTCDLTFRDAHLLLKTESPAHFNTSVTTSDAGFPTPEVELGGPLNQWDSLGIYWDVGNDPNGSPNPPLTGRQHLGVEFEVDTAGQKKWFPKVIVSALTQVTCDSAGIKWTDPIEEWAVPGPVTTSCKRVDSVDWEFGLDDPWLPGGGPVGFTNVSFYKTNTEPALSDLTAANFPSLPKTFLQSEPDFSLYYGQTHPVHIPGVDYPEWLLIEYTAYWTDPVLTTMLGVPAVVDVNVWVAGEVVPEPAAMALMAVGGLALIRRRRRQGRGEARSLRL